MACFYTGRSRAKRGVADADRFNFSRTDGFRRQLSPDRGQRERGGRSDCCSRQREPSPFAVGASEDKSRGAFVGRSKSGPLPGNFARWQAIGIQPARIWLLAFDGTQPEYRLRTEADPCAM